MSYLKRFCEECGMDKKRDEYKVNQWRNCGKKARCLDCQTKNGKTAKKAKGFFKKGEVVHCEECDQYMKAPEEEEVSGLRCAVPDCRHLIWAPGAKNPLPSETEDEPPKKVRMAPRRARVRPTCFSVRSCSRARA